MPRSLNTGAGQAGLVRLGRDLVLEYSQCLRMAVSCSLAGLVAGERPFGPSDDCYSSSSIQDSQGRLAI